MGLDVRVYRNVKQVQDIEQSNFTAHVLNNEWLDRIKNLKNDGYYVGDKDEDILIAYPCSYHNDFRRALCGLIGFNPSKWEVDTIPKDAPFYELFEFADNSGVMDWETVRKLRYDFIDTKEEAVKKLSDEWLGVHKEWLNLLTAAEDKNSVIVFS